MSDFTPAPRRQTPTEITENRRAAAAIRPFVARFEDWNKRAAKSAAVASSNLSTAAERREHTKALEQLHQEIQQAYDDFEMVVAGVPAHGRIDDLRAAFTRLLAVLRPWQSAR